jgi:hypothetical protein
MDKRAMIRVQLDSVAKKRLESLCQSRGMTQITVMSRLVNWFTDQDVAAQNAVLGGLSAAAARELARLRRRGEGLASLR